MTSGASSYIEHFSIAQRQRDQLLVGQFICLAEEKIDRHRFGFRSVGNKRELFLEALVVIIGQGLPIDIWIMHQSFISRIFLASSMVSISPVCLFFSSESLITGVQRPSSGSASVILMTIFIGSKPTSFVKLVPIPNDMPIFLRQWLAMRSTFS